METMMEDEAKAAGYATFSKCPHVCIDVPNGVTTFSFKTEEGKRLTISFLPYITGGYPQCADIAYHDSGVDVITKSKEPMPGAHWLLWNGDREHDTRKTRPVAFATVLMDQDSYPKEDSQ